MSKDALENFLVMLAANAGNYVMPDGRKVKITVVEQTKTETEVSAKFEDCWERVKPMFYVNRDNEINVSIAPINKPMQHNAVPTERNARQLQAFAKLLVIMHDLNGGEWIPKDGESIYRLVYLREADDFYTRKTTRTNESPIRFRTEELAQKALEANKQLFRDFYGV